jgi:hypothetical protein
VRRWLPWGSPHDAGVGTSRGLMTLLVALPLFPALLGTALLFSTALRFGRAPRLEIAPRLSRTVRVHVARVIIPPRHISIVPTRPISTS